MQTRRDNETMQGESPVVNPTTGLREGWDSYYKVPVVHQSGIDQLNFNGNSSGVHSVPLGAGLTLDFFAKLDPASELVVTFTGSIPKGKRLYPNFWRVSTFRRSSSALLSFADPSLLLDPSEQMRVAWYLGGASLDPGPLMLEVVRRAQQKAGAKHVVFVGGSGGGLPALRLSSMLPGSLAYLHEGATNVLKSIPLSVERYFKTAWPAEDYCNLVAAHPERFDMVSHYAKSSPRNLVYAVQSEDDLRFRRDHYTPFREAMQVDGEQGVSSEGDRHFILYKGEVAGHGKVTPGEFAYHHGRARGLWREWRVDDI